MNDRAMGFDRVAPLRLAKQRHVSKAKRTLSVRQALEWAFMAEQASMDFDELRGPDGCDTIWKLMQRGLLGCEIDGGGISARHDDAEVIASLVARLPVALGGRGMAIRIASLARCGSVPDWMPDARQRCVPMDTRMTRHGPFARTEVVGSVETIFRGRRIKHDVVACPVTYRPSAAQISAARREYLDWWGAMLDLRHTLALAGLRTIEITNVMPPMQPWHKAIDAQDVNL
jgi:hypothetical protein